MSFAGAQHNTLPKSTRRNVKLNKFAFGTHLDVPPSEMSPTAKNQEKRLFSQTSDLLIFILKEASEEQLKSLVVGSKQGKIADEELEKLMSKQSISKNQAKLKGRREKLLPLIFLFLKSKGTDAFGPFNAPIASCLKPLF